MDWSTRFVFALALATLGWVGGWFLLGEFELLPVRDLGFGLIAIVGWCTALFLIGAGRMIVIRPRPKPAKPNFAAAKSGWVFAGLGCLAVALLMLQFNDTTLPPDLPKDQVAAWIYPGISRAVLLLCAGMTMLAIRFLTYKPQPPQSDGGS